MAKKNKQPLQQNFNAGFHGRGTGTQPSKKKYETGTTDPTARIKRTWRQKK